MHGADRFELIADLERRSPLRPLFEHCAYEGQEARRFVRSVACTCRNDDAYADDGQVVPLDEQYADAVLQGERLDVWRHERDRRPGAWRVFAKRGVRRDPRRLTGDHGYRKRW